MFCRNCGTKLDDKANFCNRCGTRCVRPAPSVVKTAPIDQRLSYAEKERIMVMRVTIEDMQKFTALPYIWNSRITKYIDPSAHPFAYINLFGPLNGAR